MRELTVSSGTTESVIRTAALATVATTVATALAGLIENRNAAAPINAISHVVWGDRAAHQEALTAKYTALGAAVNAAAMVSWAAFHHLAFKPHGRPTGFVNSLARGAATAGVAYVVDYHVVPRRLTPGFEKRLPGRALFVIYAVMAASLAVGERLTQDARR